MIAVMTDGLETAVNPDETDVMTIGPLDAICSTTVEGGTEEVAAEMLQQNANVVRPHLESPRSPHRISQMLSRSLTGRDD